jgi:hypothetical protein
MNGLDATLYFKAGYALPVFAFRGLCTPASYLHDTPEVWRGKGAALGAIWQVTRGKEVTRRKNSQGGRDWLFEITN